MNYCLLCNRMLSPYFTFKDLLGPQPLQMTAVCERCEESFAPSRAPHHCPGCGRGIDESSEICNECQQWKQREGWLLVNHSLYRYNAAMKDYMHRYKFQGDFRLRKVFYRDLTRAVQIRTHGALVIPIPVTPDAWEHRGFNQVTGLLGIPYQELLQTRSQDKSVPQSAKGRAQRLAMPQPFKLAAGTDRLIAGKRVILVDDIYTTGRTLYHAASLLRSAGAADVRSVTLAH